MTEAEHDKKLAELDIEIDKSAAREKKAIWDATVRKGQADADIANAQARGEFEREEIELQKSKITAEWRTAEAEKGFKE